MTTQTHVKAARELLKEAEDGFRIGDHLIASEKLWEAAAHATRAVAKHRGWPCGDRDELLKTAARLTRETSDERYIGGFGVAEGFLENSTLDWMEDSQLEDHDLVRIFIEDMLDLLTE